MISLRFLVLFLPCSKVTECAGNHRAAQALAGVLKPSFSQTKMGFSLSAEICVAWFMTDTILSDTARKAGVTQAAHSRVQKTQDHTATTETASLDISMLTWTSAYCSIQDRSLMENKWKGIWASVLEKHGIREAQSKHAAVKKRTAEQQICSTRHQRCPALHKISGKHRRN